MAHTANVFQVMIASPGDVTDLRRLVPALFDQWISANGLRCILHPRMWEQDSTPELGSHPQEVLNDQLVDNSDLLIAVFWSRLGSPTPKARSGTIHKIHRFIEVKGPRRAMVYFYDRPLAISPFDINTTELKSSKTFDQKCNRRGYSGHLLTKASFV